MASDTAPAAVPDPANPTPASGPLTGPLTSLLAPVEPARPTSAAFNIDPDTVLPDTGPQAGTAIPQEGASSASYRTDDTTNSSTKTQNTSVLRAFAFAAIERWKKGADARNKALDIKKANALAHRVKESRTVNRTENMANGSGSSGLGSGKHTNSKSSKSGNTGSTRSNGSRNRSGGSGAGRSGGGGSAPGGSGSSSGGSHKASDQKDSHKNSSRRSRDTGGNNRAKQDSARGGGSAGSKHNGASGGNGSTGSAGKDGAPGKNGSAGSPSNSGKTPAGTSASHCSPEGLALDKKPSRKDRKNSPSSTGQVNPAGTDGSSTSKVSLKKTPTSTTRTTDQTKNGPDTTSTPTKTGKDHTRTPASTAPATGPRPNTQPSREAGYRDGARTATLTAHVLAYRDGFKDGHRDTTEAAQLEKTRLDQAHADRKTARGEDQQVTASSTDYRPQYPQPVQVKEVTDSHVVLDGGQSFTRGEIRTLKQYERRMNDKAQTMATAADGTRQLQNQATAQAEQALRFLEMSKTIEGGDKLTAILTRLHDSATVQAGAAEELHKKVVRAAESTQVLLANVETRYGSIYQAVCDSDLTKPAELAWYRK
ncbi:hypothetical protein ACIQVL_48930 [Streptomyces sp. NPDC090499]|uniref:hypothetical protein n=1 Tax=Streptomyces sp. NPDC090499 TaxID=3365965 RepID=UPI003824CC26